MISDIWKRNAITISIVILFLGLALTSTVGSRIIDEKPKIDSIVFLEASNSYNYGFKAGNMYTFQYKILDLLTRFLDRDKSSDNELRISSLETCCPEFLEELKGLSDSTNIRIERLLEIQVFLSKFLSGHCTVTLSTGPATKDNQTYLSQNWDVYGYGLTKYLVSLYTYMPHIRRIGTNYRYVYLGIPVLSEIFLMNEKGLCWCGTETSLTENESRYIDEGDGVPIYFLERKTMETCKNVSEVAYLWVNSNRSADKDKIYPRHFDFGTSGWADGEGGILYIEQSHNHILTVFGNSTEITNTSAGILWHSLHHIWIDPNLTGSKYAEECLTSPYKTARAKQLLEGNYGNITVDVLKALCRDHAGGFDPNAPDPADICWHPTKENPYITSFSWIAQPKNLTLYWTHRQPCKGYYWEYDFTRIFT